MSQVEQSAKPKRATTATVQAAQEKKTAAIYTGRYAPTIAPVADASSLAMSDIHKRFISTIGTLIELVSTIPQSNPMQQRLQASLKVAAACLRQNMTGVIAESTAECVYLSVIAGIKMCSLKHTVLKAGATTPTLSIGKSGHGFLFGQKIVTAKIIDDIEEIAVDPTGPMTSDETAIRYYPGEFGRPIYTNDSSLAPGFNLYFTNGADRATFCFPVTRVMNWVCEFAKGPNAKITFKGFDLYGSDISAIVALFILDIIVGSMVIRRTTKVVQESDGQNIEQNSYVPDPRDAGNAELKAGEIAVNNASLISYFNGIAANYSSLEARCHSTFSAICHVSSTTGNPIGGLGSLLNGITETDIDRAMADPGATLKDVITGKGTLGAAATRAINGIGNALPASATQS